MRRTHAGYGEWQYRDSAIIVPNLTDSSVLTQSGLTRRLAFNPD